jgi:hypothetical protein
VLIVNGGVTEERPLAECVMLEWVLPNHTRWCVAEMRDKQGEMRAVTNPIVLVLEHENAPAVSRHVLTHQVVPPKARVLPGSQDAET